MTTPGNTFASRVAGSLNHHLGMTYMNCADDGAFIETAISIGSDAQRLAALHEELAARRADSGLFDMRVFATDFTTLLQQLVDQSHA